MLIFFVEKSFSWKMIGESVGNYREVITKEETEEKGIKIR